MSGFVITGLRACHPEVAADIAGMLPITGRTLGIRSDTRGDGPWFAAALDRPVKYRTPSGSHCDERGRYAWVTDVVFRAHERGTAPSFGMRRFAVDLAAVRDSARMSPHVVDLEGISFIAVVEIDDVAGPGLPTAGRSPGAVGRAAPAPDGPQPGDALPQENSPSGEPALSASPAIMAPTQRVAVLLNDGEQPAPDAGGAVGDDDPLGVLPNPSPVDSRSGRPRSQITNPGVGGLTRRPGRPVLPDTHNRPAAVPPWGDIRPAAGAAPPRRRAALLAAGAAALLAVSSGVFWLVRDHAATGSVAAGESSISVQPSGDTAPPKSPPAPEDVSTITKALPPGYTKDVCRPQSQPAEGGRATVECGPNADVGGPVSATYTLFADRAALNAAFETEIRGFDQQMCPGRILSPGPWRRNATPSQLAGTLFCGKRGQDQVIIWSDSSRQLLTTARTRATGPSLEAMYGWWSTHS